MDSLNSISDRLSGKFENYITSDKNIDREYPPSLTSGLSVRYYGNHHIQRLSVCPKGLWDQQSGTARTDNNNKVRARDADTGGVTTTLQRNPVQSRLNPFADNNSKTVRQQFAPRTLNLGGVRRRHSNGTQFSRGSTPSRITTARQ